jgi:hypothetical protein
VEVAVIPVKMVESPVDEVIDVIAVRDGGVSAAGVVFRRALDGRARRGPTPVDLEDVLRDARIGGRVEVPVVEIIGVIAMTNGPVTAARSVHVGVVVPVLHFVSSSSARSIVRTDARGQGGVEPS